MRRLLLATTAAAFVASAGSAFADTSTFTVSATTQAGISVSCGQNLSFGTLGVESPSTESVITVAASLGASAVVDSGTGVTPLSGSQPAVCTVSNETDGDADAALSATSIGLSAAGQTDLTASSLNLSKTTLIGNGDLYVGGSLTIPADHTGFASYTSGTVTVTVTE